MSQVQTSGKDDDDTDNKIRLDRICEKCRSFLGITLNNDDDGATNNTEASSNKASSCCTVCLGLWQQPVLQSNLQDLLKQACEPYGGFSADKNRFSRQQPPTVVLPGDLFLRYELAAAALTTRSKTTTAVFVRELKEHIKSILMNCIPQNPHHPSSSRSFLDDEEQGYLCVHVVLVPALIEQRPACGFHPSNNRKRIRKRFRGNDPTEKQGGDARVNLEQRLQQQDQELLWSMTEVETALDRASPHLMKELQAWFLSLQNQQASMTTSPGEQAYKIRVAVWRRPFYVRSLYTKSRRDVSQTPFYVPNSSKKDGPKMKRLGVTSVEEEICPILAKHCGGISKLNNSSISTDNKANNNNNVVFGMVKFHASGREDMDVRMLLPPSENNKNVAGRPFCCQVVDAYRMPTRQDLQNVINEINHTTASCNDNENNSNVNSKQKDEIRCYGHNPMGVGIASDLSLVPASSYKNLQAETESKVKYYGCVCWCQQPFASQQELEQRLGLDADGTLTMFPLQLQQQTPIRVLHRRSNMVRIRHVLTLNVIWDSEHWFRLHLSTDAGTYVKEFVHGDLGRTMPSIASLLGCKTDILQLDCEGIEGVLS